MKIKQLLEKVKQVSGKTDLEIMDLDIAVLCPDGGLDWAVTGWYDEDSKVVVIAGN
jgi:hypothetical protein